jgi:hypothetical protein
MISYDETDALRDAVYIGKSSPYAKSKRGVVIFARGYGIVGSGFNHPPEGMTCDRSAACREHCRDLCVHAEAAALLTLSRGPGPSVGQQWRRHGRGLTEFIELIDVVLPGVPWPPTGLEVLHVKVLKGEAAASGPPSCVRCSALLCDDTRISKIWLLNSAGLVSYDRAEFHRESLLFHKLPVIQPKEIDR